ncbi:unnamed protein product, partial [Rotaria magnacalcarata]
MNQFEESQEQLLLPVPSLPTQQQQQPGLLNDELISRLFNNTRSQE